MAMPDRRLEVPYQPEENDLFDSFGRGVRKFFTPEKDPDTGLTGQQARAQARANGKSTYVFKGNEYKLPSKTNMSLQPGDVGYYIGPNSKDPNLVGPAASKGLPRAPGQPRQQSRMGSDANIDRGRIGKSGFTANTPAKPPVKPRVAPKNKNGILLTNSQLDQLSPRPGAMQSYDSGTLNPSEFGPATMGPGVGFERGNVTSQGIVNNYETMFPTETFNPPVAPMREGLFGEQISQEDWDAMTQRNKDASFWGRFKKGGSVKKKPVKKMAKGGSVSSASKRADGCAQRGKTKGRMV